MEYNHRKGSLYAVAAALLWGFLAIALKVLTGVLDPVTVVWFRFATAFLILALWTLIFRRKDFEIFRRPPHLLFLGALFLGLNYLGFISGVKYVSPTTSQIFIQIGPVTFAMAGIVLFREMLSWKHIVGFLLVIAGMFLFYSEQLRALGGGGEDVTKGLLLVLGGGISWAAFAVVQKKLLKSVEANQLNLFIYAACALVLLPMANFSRLGELTPGLWIVLVYTGLNTVLAYGSLALAIKWTAAARVSVILTMNPIITFVVMVIVGRMDVSWVEAESFTLLSLSGAAVVLAGAVLVISARWKKQG